MNMSAYESDLPGSSHFEPESGKSPPFSEAQLSYIKWRLFIIPASQDNCENKLILKYSPNSLYEAESRENACLPAALERRSYFLGL